MKAMRYAGHVARLEETKTEYRTSIGNPKGEEAMMARQCHDGSYRRSYIVEEKFYVVASTVQVI
jgi:hypothetical protein